MDDLIERAKRIAQERAAEVMERLEGLEWVKRDAEGNLSLNVNLRQTDEEAESPEPAEKPEAPKPAEPTVVEEESTSKVVVDDPLLEMLRHHEQLLALHKLGVRQAMSALEEGDVERAKKFLRRNIQREADLEQVSDQLRGILG